MAEITETPFIKQWHVHVPTPQTKKGGGGKSANRGLEKTD